MSKRKPYPNKMENDWWLKQIFFTKYMIREGSAIFITIYSLILCWGIFRLSQGATEFGGWLESLQNPFLIIFHLIALIFALYHTVTWFNLAPKASDLWLNGKKIEDKLIVSILFGTFAVASVFCLLIITL